MYFTTDVVGIITRNALGHTNNLTSRPSKLFNPNYFWILLMFILALYRGALLQYRTSGASAMEETQRLVQVENF